MASRPRILIAATVILLLGAGGLVHEVQLLREETGLATEEHAKQDALNRHLSELRQAHASLLHELVETRKEIANQAAQASTGPEPDGRDRTEIGPWLARIQTIRHLFATNPETRIPELQFLQESDWILLTREADLDTEENIRKSLAALRDAGKRTFTRYLQSAMSAYVRASDGQLPPTVEALGPYFNPSVDPALLSRYEIVRSGSVADLPKEKFLIVREKTPVDEDFDGRFGLNVSGGQFMIAGGGNDARTWLSDPDGYEGMIRKARVQFGQAHSSAKADGLEQLAPYIDPPLPPEKLQKLIDLERSLQRR